MNPPTVCLVSCSKSKLARPAPAAELYSSPRFRLARRYAERFDEWYILSAQYGLVDPTHVIEPYDLTLNKLSAPKRHRWSGRVVSQMAQHTGAAHGSRVIILAGAHYREFIEPILQRVGMTVEAPLAHLSQGAQLRWLSQHAKE